MDQYEIAEILREMARIIDFLEEKPFRAIAYMKAAKTLENIGNFEELVTTQQLITLPGIGKEISKIVTTLFNNEPLPYLERLRNEIPETLFTLFAIPKLGKKKVKFLYKEFHITHLDELEEALQKNAIPRFRKATVKNLLLSIKKLKREGRKVLWQQGMKIAHSLCNKLFSNEIEIVGQLRRKLETISHIELLIQNVSPDVFEQFSQHSFIKKIIYKRATKIRVLLKQGITADLQIVKKENWPFSLIKHTGSKKHLKELKKEAHSLGISFHQKTFKRAQDENAIYKALQMKYIEPEIREGTKEIAAAKKNLLPKLIKEEDIRGVFHCHTIESDGISSIEEMAMLAQDMGWEYIGISDHSKSSVQANGLSEERLFQQLEHIKNLNQKSVSFKIFSGIECDILENGELDFSDDILKYLDFVIVSVHSLFRLDKRTMTKRIIKAIENPYTTMIGHVSGRLLLHRDPYQIDLPKIIDAAAYNNKIIELNATPSRLDMDWRYWHFAKEKGVKCAINVDAHKLEDFQNYKLGINCARKGWLEKEDVINTLSLKDMAKFLRVKPSGK